LHYKVLKIFIIVGLCFAPGSLLPADELSVTRPILSYELPNGLKVLLNPDSSQEQVTVNVVYKTGAKHEGPGEYGMAHLLEHLAFNNTKNHRNIPQELQRRGARFNANTNADRTTYYETLPASLANLEFALAMEADRMMQADLSETAIEREMQVVKSEWEQSGRSGFQPLLREMLELAYPHHAYGRDTFGIQQGLTAEPRHSQSLVEKLRSFYARRYVPGLAVLSLGGPFLVDDAKRLIEKYFAPLPRGPQYVEEPAMELKPQWGERLVVIPKPGGPSFVGVVYRAMPGADASYVAAQALVHCLSSHPESILQKKLVRSGLAHDAFGFVQSSVEEGFIAFMARPVQAHDPVHVVKRLAQLVESAAMSCQNRDLLRFQQENAEAWMELAQDVRSFTMQLGEFEVLGDWRLMQDQPKRSMQLRLDAVKNVSRWLTRNNRTAGVLDHRTKHSLAGRQALP
jgi:zinc protease